MSDDYTYQDWRTVQEGRQELSDKLDHDQDVPADFQERAKHQSYSQTYRERVNGLLLSEQEVLDWLHDDDHEPPSNLSTEALIDWVPREEAKKVRAYRKNWERWRRLFGEDVLSEKRREVLHILSKAKRRIENET